MKLQKILKDFNQKIEKGSEKFNNDLIKIVEWFNIFFDLYFFGPNHKKVFKKGDIYYVDLGHNIGSELNKKRPCIVISNDKINRGDTVLVLPLKTLKNDKIYFFSVKINKTEENNLDLISYCNITDLRSVSKKRISKFIGKISNNDLEKIKQKINKYL